MKSILKIALISIIANLIFLSFLIVLSLIYIHAYNPKIQIADLVLNKGGIPRLSILKSTEQKDIDNFNKSQSASFSKEWNLTKSRVKEIIDCQNVLQKEHSDLEQEHIEFLRASALRKVTDELQFYEAIYRDFSKLSNILKGSVTDVFNLSSDKPQYPSNIFVVINDPKKNKESAAKSLQSIVSELTKIRRYADNFSCNFPNDVKYEQREIVCKDLVDFYYNYLNNINPVLRETYTIEEEYNVQLKRRQNIEGNLINACLSHSFNIFD